MTTLIQSKSVDLLLGLLDTLRLGQRDARKSTENIQMITLRLLHHYVLRCILCICVLHCVCVWAVKLYVTESSLRIYSGSKHNLVENSLFLVLAFQLQISGFHFFH